MEGGLAGRLRWGGAGSAGAHRGQGPPAGRRLARLGGQFENLERARARLAVVVPLCGALIIALLYSAVGSWRKTAIILTGVPLALVGGIAALWLRGMPFSITAAVGFIALCGVAVLNGLVMVSANRSANSPIFMQRPLQSCA